MGIHGLCDALGGGSGFPLPMHCMSGYTPFGNGDTGVTSVKFMALGGGREIGANSFYYDLDGHGLLVDSGLHPEKVGWDAFPRLKALEGAPVETLLVTHAHTDHLGAVPYVMQENPNATLYGSPETIDLARIMLANSSSLLPKQHPKEVIDRLECYSLEGIEEILGKFNPFELNETKSFRSKSGKEIKVTFYPAGHILGAGGFLIEMDGKRIFHTGDTSLHAQRLVSNAQLPTGHVDVLVTESTNGFSDAYLTHSRDLELERLIATLNETIESGGSILIPVFALGKMQEVLAMLWDAMQAKKLPMVDIYTGGMARRISDVYDLHAKSVSRTGETTPMSEIPQKEIPRRDALFSGKFFKTPSIVLAASGMMQEGTASYFLAQRWLRHTNFSICFVGYTDPRTPGFVVSHAEPGARLRFGSMKRDVPVRCKVERFRFSAHARREELLEIATRLQPKHVVLTHGDEKAMAAFGELILQAIPGVSVSAPEVGKWYSLME